MAPPLLGIEAEFVVVVVAISFSTEHTQHSFSKSNHSKLQVQVGTRTAPRSMIMYHKVTSCYLSVKSLSLVETAPNNSTETRYKPVVVKVAAKVPTGIER